MERYDENVCGRPLGMTVSPLDGLLWVLDATLGLYTVNTTTGTDTVSSSQQPIILPNSIGIRVVVYL